MEWKKEKISASELERRQKEYMNAAMSMVKRSQTVTVTVTEPVPEPEPEPVIPEPPEAVVIAGSAEEKAPGPAEKPESPEESAPEPEPASGPDPEPENKPEPEPEESANYGVYTADELLNGEAEGAGLKKAAEILEEMTRSTEMMRKLAHDDDEPGTTDFPDFSCGTDSGDDGDCFREYEEAADDECSPPEDDPEQCHEPA